MIFLILGLETFATTIERPYYYFPGMDTGFPISSHTSGAVARHVQVVYIAIALRCSSGNQEADHEGKDGVENWWREERCLVILYN